VFAVAVELVKIIISFFNFFGTPVVRSRCGFCAAVLLFPCNFFLFMSVGLAAPCAGHGCILISGARFAVVMGMIMGNLVRILPTRNRFQHPVGWVCVVHRACPVFSSCCTP
jgi:hypothetical protein